MSRRIVVFKLRNDAAGQIEGVQVRADGTWQSSPGGWLPWQSGKWEEIPRILYLKNDAANGTAAELRDANFQTVTAAAQGNALYPTIAGTGTWECIDVTSDP